jgi:hypothetical protein
MSAIMSATGASESASPGPPVAQHHRPAGPCVTVQRRAVGDLDKLLDLFYFHRSLTATRLSLKFARKSSNRHLVMNGSSAAA